VNKRLPKNKAKQPLRPILFASERKVENDAVFQNIRNYERLFRISEQLV